MRFALLLLLAGCRTPPIDAIGVSPTDFSPPADFSKPPGDMASPPNPNGPCRAWNWLSRDSFDVVAAAVKDCLDNPATTVCQFHPTWIWMPGLAEGVGDISFDWGDNFDGTFILVGHGTPDVSGGPAGIILNVDPIPASVGFHPALHDIYLGALPADCAWQ